MAIIEIDPQELSDETLSGIIKEFIFTQTMNLSCDFDMDEEILKVKKLLKNQKAKILFDEETEICQIQIDNFRADFGDK